MARPSDDFQDDGMSVRQRSRVREQQKAKAEAAHKAAILDWIKFKALTCGIIGTVGLAFLLPFIVVLWWLFFVGVFGMLTG